MYYCICVCILDIYCLWYIIYVMYMYSNVLIAPCSTADPGIAGAVLLQNKTNTKIERLIILD